MMPTDHGRRASHHRDLELARVLLVHEDLAPRLTLQTLLRAGGYFVDSAASSAEALAKLDEQEYELVLTGQDASAEASRGLLAYARAKGYRPATAVITAYPDSPTPRGIGQQRVSIDTEDVTRLLSKVADLIGLRASRRAGRALRQ